MIILLRVTVFRSRPIIDSNNPCWDLAEVDLDCCCRNEDLVRIIRIWTGYGLTTEAICELTRDMPSWWLLEQYHQTVHLPYQEREEAKTGGSLRNDNAQYPGQCPRRC